MDVAYPVRRTIFVLFLIVIFLTVVLSWVRYLQRRQTAVHIPIRSRTGQALLRYVQLRHQSSEEVAYQYIADFVKKHVSPGEQAAIDILLAQDRQSLLELAHDLLRHFPEELGEI